MAEFKLLNQISPLTGLAQDQHKVGAGTKGFTLREFWPFVATQIAWPTGKAKDVAKALGLPSLPETMMQGYVALDEATKVLPLMPNRVLHLGAKPLGEAETSQLEKIGAYTLDLTEGRVMLGLRGDAWRWILMKGAGLDFETFNVGAVAQTSLFKVSTLIWVVEPNEVRLLVSYTFARAFAEKLLDAGADQGLQLVPSELS